MMEENLPTFINDQEEMVVNKTVKEMLIDSLINTQQMFLHNQNKKIVEQDKVNYKMTLKIHDEYKHANINEDLIKPNKYSDKLSFRSENKEKSEAAAENHEKDASLNEKEDDQIKINTNISLNTITKSSTITPKEFNLTKENDPSIVSTSLVKITNEEEKEIFSKIPEKYSLDNHDETTPKLDNLVLSLYRNQNHISFRKNKLVTPDWHPKWKLYRVISGHTGWVRCIDVDPTNQWFVTGSNDRVIKFWDLAKGKLKLSLTGHINTVRQVIISPRHPYLFSCGEDKLIKCWDLEQNKVVRHYHGHLSGVYSLSLHPILDVLISGGRDCVAKLWDIRSKQQIMNLEGHNNNLCSILSQEFEPQVITGSHDATIRLWDIRTAKCINTLTHHKKSIRSMTLHHEDYSFISGGCDNLKVWKFPEGKFLRNISGHNAIVNAVALNKDGVLVSGGDNGSLMFWDYKSGVNFQTVDTKVQPGSLSCEAGIFAIKFDQSSTRMITGECDKTIKMWKEDDECTPENFPLNFK